MLCEIAGGIGEPVTEFALTFNNIVSVLRDKNLPGWFQDSTGVCDWGGLSCNDGILTGRHMNGWDLEGEILPS